MCIYSHLLCFQWLKETKVHDITISIKSMHVTNLDSFLFASFVSMFLYTLPKTYIIAMFE